MNTSRPFNEKFQNAPFLRKMPYYCPWFFIVLKRYFKRPYYRPWCFGKMFKREISKIAHGFSEMF